MLQRGIGFIVMFILGMVFAAEPGQAGGYTLNIWNTLASAYNREVVRLMTWVLAFAALVFVVVTAALVYVVIKFRRTGKETSEPVQTHGNHRLEVVWTVIPTVIVLIIFGLTSQSMFKLDRPPPGAMVVQVRAWQFWWDFYYQEYGIRTSSELILPVGRPVTFEITSGTEEIPDVIHSFRITSMVGTMDAIPGVITRLHVTPEKIGSFYGQCVELCGVSHANMRFRVKVVSQEKFDRWIEGARNFQPAPVIDPVLKRGKALYMLHCAACHTVTGVSRGTINNPDLTFFGNRTTVGSGMWPNTHEFLTAWIKDSPGMKPGIGMPAFPNLTDEDARAIADYLMTLRVEGLDFSQLPRY